MRQNRLAQRGALTLEYGIVMSGMSLAFVMAVIGWMRTGAAEADGLFSSLRQLAGLMF